MHIRLNGIMVEDQERALDMYTRVLGFVVKDNIPMGEYRWISVVSPSEPDGAALTLEPNAFPPAATFQKALFEAGIPYTALEVDDIDAEFERLTAEGVRFTTPPTDAGGPRIATFDDTCGNLIQLYQMP